MAQDENFSTLPDIIDPTVAADSVRSQREALLCLIRHCLLYLADALLANFIIPADVYEKVCNQHLEKNERGRALLDCVEDRIRLRASYFTIFIDILKYRPFLNDLAEILIQSYCTLSLTPPAERIATISPAISQYAAYLKGVYRNSPISPDNKWPPTPSKKYINLATVKHNYKLRDEFIGHTLHGNVKEALMSREEITIDKILVPDEEGVAYLKLVIVEGAPGIGKSTLAWELCRKWEQGCMEKYSLTVLLRLREKRVQEIRSIAELFYSCPSKYKDALLNDVSSYNGKGVLFILDGFDELPTTLQKEGFLVDIVRRVDFLPECTVLVTSRPSATAKLLTICRPQIQKHIEIMGFTQESVEEYATSIFSSEPERLNKFKAFISASENPAINSLMYIPLNAAIIVEIYQGSKSDNFLPHTLTQLYTQLCLTILNRYLQSSFQSIEVNQFKDLPADLYEEFLMLTEVAFEGTRRQEVIFNNLPSNLVHFGFLDAVSSLYGGNSVSYNFLHLTVQEFFTAYHISQLCNDTKLAIFSEYGSDEHWSVVWRFVAGLTEFKFFKGHVNSGIFILVEDSEENEVVVKPLFIQCLFEANMKLGRSQLFGLKNITLDLSDFLTPLDLYASGYCIANLTSEVAWNVRMDQGYVFKGFVDGLKTSNVTSNNVSKVHISMAQCPVFYFLKHFPLHGITEIFLDGCSISAHDLEDLRNSLSSMISLKKLNFSSSTSFGGLVGEYFNLCLKQLSQTNVTSLNITNIDFDEPEYTDRPLCVLCHLSGTLEELCAGPFDMNDDLSVLRMVRASTSLKSLMLLHPLNISALTCLATNTYLTKLHIRFAEISEEVVKVVEILRHNEILEHLTVGDFELPRDVSATRDIVTALSTNNTLRSVTVSLKEDDIEHEKIKEGVIEDHEYEKDNEDVIEDNSVSENTEHDNVIECDENKDCKDTEYDKDSEDVIEDYEETTYEEDNEDDYEELYISDHMQEKYPDLCSDSRILFYPSSQLLHIRPLLRCRQTEFLQH